MGTCAVIETVIDVEVGAELCQAQFKLGITELTLQLISRTNQSDMRKYVKCPRTRIRQFKMSTHISAKHTRFKRIWYLYVP
jgi:hypothetical protein